MSSEQLKTSLRHTHAYIEAYDVELLADVEGLFRQALDQVDEAPTESTQADVAIHFDAPAEPPPSLFQAAQPPHEERPIIQENALETLANWHFYLPAILGGVAVAVILFRGWLS
ncbi:hypothetical protein [Pseudomonas yangonensis]|uniref:hypothetical protein n=1 Tax=Pseudomonas yangonensis TaxID=2579922 RepID=UPI0013798C51|nr:hypothetical protein [Pseudomonas yangonensis]